jgi:hypothetical protein
MPNEGLGAEQVAPMRRQVEALQSQGRVAAVTCR